MSIQTPSAPTDERLRGTWQAPPGLRGFASALDHKRTGRRYLVTAFAFLLVGGAEALLVRTQLARADSRLLTPAEYDQLFTMHGVTMIFLYAAPVLVGFSSYLWPLVVGAREMAFPRLNTFAYWMYLCAGIFLYSSALTGRLPDTGWFSYVPLSDRDFTPTLNLDFYLLALLLLTVSTTAVSINYVATFARIRAPGMSLSRLPILVWGTVSSAAANLFALPALTAACAFLFLDRRYGTRFFDPAVDGQPLLWQHLFWMFGHPWVYIVVLPAMGLVSEVIPTFCRRPLVGYTWVAGATVATSALGFGVWIHHMFATGLDPVSLAFFGGSSLLIAIPSAVSLSAWISTIWHGRPVLATPMLFMSGFILLFVMGGVTGVMTAVVPFDWQLTDTYFVVGHLHYTLAGINLFPVLGALFYWFPKITGRMLDERLGRLSFWVLFAGANLVFFPMLLVGLMGMPRRVYTYPGGLGWTLLNALATFGAFLFAAGVLTVLFNVVRALRRGPPAGPDPWGGGTLEWAAASPPSPYNFAATPVVAARYPLWAEPGVQADRAHAFAPAAGPALAPAAAPGTAAPSPSFAPTSVPSVDPAEGRAVLVTSMSAANPKGVLHLPDDTTLPLLTALSLTAVAYGLLGVPALTVVGIVGAAACVVAWLWPVAASPGPVATAFGTLPRDGSGVRAAAWWGMMAFTATQAALFAYLLFAYGFLGLRASGSWPTALPPLGPATTGTVLLLLSCMAAWWASRAAARDARRTAALALAATLLLGVAVLALQAADLLRALEPATADAYGSIFAFTLGAQVAHVAVGVVVLAVGLAAYLRRRATAERPLAVQLAAFFWYFVALVWLAVYATLYLSPRL
ncbi:MAG: Cytochrome c oxidase polypeptide I [uncultured Gemmatimonadetes bacterium]|uniref:Cytochrome c oxidase polypeptide I n=1 Tax=uncultured Gemmatimonadota bacterium TaxID=203437 RepID=A0A6J4MMF3_9BACT|nr:MAG: Cytochrome c oxidase polypeptide I [uncultured Gemmatimonadota bacterium]